MSTPLLPEVTPEIDTNPVFFSGEGGAVMASSFTHPHPSFPCHVGYLQSFDRYNHNYLGFREFARYGE